MCELLVEEVNDNVVRVYGGCTGPCNIGFRALPDAVPLEKGMILSDGQFSYDLPILIY